jgi:hypothetical protein
MLGDFSGLGDGQRGSSSCHILESTFLNSSSLQHPVDDSGENFFLPFPFLPFFSFDTSVSTGGGGVIILGTGTIQKRQ